MIVALWGSWLLLFILARLLVALMMVLTMLALVLLPGNRNRRFARLTGNGYRGLFGVSIVVSLVALAGVYFLAQWWFTLINFAPVNVAVFGSVGIAAITWVMTIFKKRHRLSDRLAAYRDQHADDDDQ
ncbi:hypothetical protein [Lacticaseibacillus sp. GG6-2]